MGRCRAVPLRLRAMLRVLVPLWPLLGLPSTAASTTTSVWMSVGLGVNSLHNSAALRDFRDLKRRWALPGMGWSAAASWGQDSRFGQHCVVLRQTYQESEAVGSGIRRQEFFGGTYQNWFPERKVWGTGVLYGRHFQRFSAALGVSLVRELKAAEFSGFPRSMHYEALSGIGVPVELRLRLWSRNRLSVAAKAYGDWNVRRPFGGALLSVRTQVLRREPVGSNMARRPPTDVNSVLASFAAGVVGGLIGVLLRSTHSAREGGGELGIVPGLVATPMLVYIVGNSRAHTGSLLATVTGALAGGGMVALFFRSVDGALVVGAPVGAALGFGQSRRYMGRSATR